YWHFWKFTFIYWQGASSNTDGYYRRMEHLQTNAERKVVLLVEGKMVAKSNQTLSFRCSDQWQSQRKYIYEGGKLSKIQYLRGQQVVREECIGWN
ncbi:MAG: hypothetical protein AAF570_21320, partial [Bacteroidota bacterium]